MNARKAAQAIALPAVRRRAAAGMAAGALLALGAALTALQARAAEHEEITVTHGISTFGELKYPADMERLDYVNPDAPKGGEISLWWAGGFDSMNPYTRKGRAGYLSSIFFESLLAGTADEIGSAYCLLCETMEYPESRDWVIFNIRPEAKFSDGTDVTADDFVFTHDIFLREGLPSFRAVLPQTIATVEALGPKQVKYTFTEGSPKRDRIQTAGGLPVFSKKWFEDNDAGLDESRLDPAVGSGPYVLDRMEVNQRIVYRRNPDYWGKDLPMNVGRHNYETIRVEYFGDSNAAFEGFKAGTYTFRIENSSKTWATGYDFPAVKDGTVVLEELPDGSIGTGQSFAINLRRDKFKDKRVRQAIALMFNFEWSNETLFYGLYERINSFWENTDLAADGPPSEGEIALLKPLVEEGLLPEDILTEPAVTAPSSGSRQLDRGNLRKASALLDEAGWVVGDDGLRRKDGQVLRIEILEDSPAFDRVVNPFVENLRRLGIDAVYNRIDPAQYTDRTRNFDFDIITDQFPMSYEPGTGLQQYFGSATKDDSVFNSMGYGSEAADRLIEIIENAETREEMVTAVKALDRVLRHEVFWIPQWFKNVHTVAYYNMYEHPEELPPFALGHLDFWWINPEKEAALKAAGKI